MKQRVSRNAKVISISMLLSSAIIAGGIAYASGDAFTACVNKKTGLTRIISGKMKCYKSERQVTWNQTGPTGSQGATGATGPSGTSEVLKKIGLNVEILRGTRQTIISATIPAGNYKFDFGSYYDIFNNNLATEKTRFAACLFSTNSSASAALVDDAASIWPKSGLREPVRISFQPTYANASSIDPNFVNFTGTFSFTQQTTVYLQCEHEVASGDANGDSATKSLQSIRFLNPTLLLTRVDTVTLIN